MRLFDFHGSLPGTDDFSIVYFGTLDNSSGALSDGTSSEFPVSTEIRTKHFVLAICEEFRGGTRRVFSAYWETSKDAEGRYTFTIEVPSGCTCRYLIIGSKDLTEKADREVGTGVGTSGDQHAGGHRHDGNDSHKISNKGIDNCLRLIIANNGLSATETLNSTGKTFTYTYPATGQYLVTASGSIFTSSTEIYVQLEGGVGITDDYTVLATVTAGDKVQIDVSNGASGAIAPARLFVTIYL